MIGYNKKTGVLPGIRYFGPAGIIEKNETDGRLRVRIDMGEDKDESVFTWASPALQSPHDLGYGDTVLVAGEHIDEFYVIGVLGCNTQRDTSQNRLVMACGAQVQKTGSADEEKLQITSPQGSLIFEYDSSTGKSRVDIPEGDLEIVTRKGNIDFTSAQGIRFSSADSVELHSDEKVAFTVTDQSGHASTAINLDPQAIDMKSPRLEINAHKADISVEDTQYKGKKATTVFETVKCITDRFESAADTVIEKLKNVYKTVEGLSQLKAGRMRTLVDATYQFKSKKAFLKSEEEFKIKGDKIYLG